MRYCILVTLCLLLTACFGDDEKLTHEEMYLLPSKDINYIYVEASTKDSCFYGRTMEVGRDVLEDNTDKNMGRWCGISFELEFEDSNDSHDVEVSLLLYQYKGQFLDAQVHLRTKDNKNLNPYIVQLTTSTVDAGMAALKRYPGDCMMAARDMYCNIASGDEAMDLIARIAWRWRAFSVGFCQLEGGNNKCYIVVTGAKPVMPFLEKYFPRAAKEPMRLLSRYAKVIGD